MENIPLRKAAEAVARVLAGAGHTVYFVGGCVRDRLLGYPCLLYTSDAAYD